MKNKNKLFQEGTLMSGLDITHNEDNNKLYYPGAFNKYQGVTHKAMKQRIKQGKLPGFITAPSSTQTEIENFINEHPKAEQLKEEIAFNEKRKKNNNPLALATIPAGVAIGATAPLGAAGLMEAVSHYNKGNRVNAFKDGVKTMINPVTKDVAEKYKIPLIGAGMGLAGGALMAKHINDKYRDKKVGKKKDEILNEVSYDLDNHMRKEDTIKRIADNSTFKTLMDYGRSTKTASSEVNEETEKIAKEKKKRNVPLRALGAAAVGATLGSNAVTTSAAGIKAYQSIKKGTPFNIVGRDILNSVKVPTAIGAATGAGLLAAKSVFKNTLHNRSLGSSKKEEIEKKAGYKRDLRIARAEAKAKNPRLMFEYANPDEYRKTMEAYADGLESFLNSKERHQDWATKKDLANLSIANGESSKDIYDSGSSVKEFVNKRIKDKHLKDKSVPYIETSKPNSFLENSPDISNRSSFRPAVSPTSSSPFNKPTTPQERLKDIRGMVGDGKLTKEQLKDHTSRREIRRNITLKDSNLSKQLMSGKHKAEMLTMDQLKGDGVYFKTHSGKNPFDIAGSSGRYIKRDFIGNPKMPKKGIPIWASKLPEVSTTYGDTVLAFKPNEAMIAGASPIDHRHLATDTRRMSPKKIHSLEGWNQGFELNRHPEYERVFTYDKKNMDKSTVATYKKHKIAPGGKFDHDAYRFTKNKPGSLADSYARKVVNGQQKAYGLSAKETKRLDRKAMLRYYDSIKDIKNPTPFELSSQKDIHNTLTNISKARKDTAFRNNMALALGAGALAGLTGYGAYKGIKKLKDKREFLKKKEQEGNEKKANSVHYELEIEKKSL